MTKEKKIFVCALFISSCVVLGRILSVRSLIITIGFAFVPIIFSAIILGPKYSTFVAVISDIIGSLLFPTGSYFFGFTITSFLTGLTYGLILHRKEFKINKDFIIRLIISAVLVCSLYNGVLNTIWVFIITKGASKIVLPIRILKQLIMMPVIVLTILLTCKALEERIKKLVND